MASKEGMENEKTGKFIKNFSSAKVKRWYVYILYIFFESTIQNLKNIQNYTIA